MGDRAGCGLWLKPARPGLDAADHVDVGWFVASFDRINVLAFVKGYRRQLVQGRFSVELRATRSLQIDKAIRLRNALAKSRPELLRHFCRSRNGRVGTPTFGLGKIA